MNKIWTLHVENFAKIEKADITIASFMCFVGDNNSGKSYLMSLLWGILTLGKDLFPKVPSKAESYKECESWLIHHLNENLELTDVVFNMYIRWFNDLLNLNKKNLLKKIFNYEVQADKIEIHSYERKTPVFLKWNENGERYSVKKNSINFPIKNEVTKEDILKMNAYICWNLLMEGIAAPLYTPAIKGRRLGEPVYLPASRTGFMLTYSQLISNSIQLSFSPETDESFGALTLPYVDFLQLITQFDSKDKVDGKYGNIIEYIEENMTHGKLTVKKDMLPVIKYQPEGSKNDMPLYVASSIVSEIAPLLLLFKSNIKFNTLLIEEPEAHLHPELQQKIAQLLIRIMALGIPVWFTTHSDTIIQHVNNMIKLANNQEKDILMKEYEYEKNDLLYSYDVNMYQFVKSGNSKSLLVKLESGKYGFEVSTFNNALQDILDEVYAFQEED